MAGAVRIWNLVSGTVFIAWSLCLVCFREKGDVADYEKLRMKCFAEVYVVDIDEKHSDRFATEASKRV